MCKHGPSPRGRGLALAVLFLCFAVHANAQDSPQPLLTPPRTKLQVVGLFGADYPTAASTGFGIVLGKERMTSGRFGNSHIKGLSASVEAGLGGVTGRLGWASLFNYDAGSEGFSVEAVYVRPWVLRWGPKAGENYIGPGMTYRLGYARISGALLVRASAGTSWRVAPSITLGFAIPLR